MKLSDAEHLMNAGRELTKNMNAEGVFIAILKEGKMFYGVTTVPEPLRKAIHVLSSGRIREVSSARVIDPLECNEELPAVEFQSSKLPQENEPQPT